MLLLSTGAMFGVSGGGADPFRSNVKLLVHFTGSNGSTTFTDQSPVGRALTAVGNAQIQSNKLELDGTGDWVTAVDSADWQITGDFTFEFFGIEFDTPTILQEICGHYNATANQRGWIFGLDGTIPELRISVSTDGSAGTVTNLHWAWAPSVATPYDLCIKRGGTSVRVYVNGSEIGTAQSYSGNSANSNQTLQIGVRGAASNELNGRMKAIRLTQGSDRYGNVSSYTVPTLPLASS